MCYDIRDMSIVMGASITSTVLQWHTFFFGVYCPNISINMLPQLAHLCNSAHNLERAKHEQIKKN